MNQDERLAQIRRTAKNDQDAITMILSACADMSHDGGALVSVNAFDRVAEMVRAYFGPGPARDIDRQALDIIAHIEQGLQTYHGMRHMWAGQVANGRICPFGQKQQVDPDVLMSLQKSQLWVIIGDALALHDLLWPQQHTPHTMYTHRGALPTYVDRMLGVTNEAIDVCDALVAYQAEYDKLSQQNGRMPGNDHWSDRGMKIVQLAARVSSRVAEWYKTE